MNEWKSDKDMIPTCCGECEDLGEYATGSYSRNPHYCCELIYRLTKEEHEVDKNTLDKHCPYKIADIRHGIIKLKEKMIYESNS